MGDAGFSNENYILDEYYLPKIDILRVGHHSSKNSSGVEFITEINPKISLISISKNNRYGHPDKEVIEKLQASGSAVYQTSIHGTIIVYLKDKTTVDTCT